MAAKECISAEGFHLRASGARCNGHLGIVLHEPCRNVPLQAVNGHCLGCGYRLAWILIRGKRYPSKWKQWTSRRYDRKYGKMSRKTLLFVGLLLFSATIAFAGGQTVISNYAAAQRDFFWTKLYLSGGSDFSCNVHFNTGQRLTIEHVYAAGWIATHHGGGQS